MPSAESPRVGIVGAGIAGLTCGRRLADAGARVIVLDKGRGPAGRASTRRVRLDDREVAFDHGAQYFTIRDTRFFLRVASWRDEGVAARWDGRIAAPDGDGDPGGVDRFVGVPGMSALGGALARGLDVRWGATVTAVEPANASGPPGGPYRLRVGSGRPSPPFDAVVVAVPPAQAVPLVEAAAADLAEVAAGHRMRPCWAAMAVFDRRLETGFDGAFFQGPPMAWAARNASKPGRSDLPDTWVVHGSPDWSEEHLEEDPDAVGATLTGALTSAAGDASDPALVRAHRWRYARSEVPRRDGSLVSDTGDLYLAGDWLAGDRIEGAYLSGWDAARRILEG